MKNETFRTRRRALGAHMNVPKGYGIMREALAVFIHLDVPTTENTVRRYSKLGLIHAKRVAVTDHRTVYLYRIADVRKLARTFRGR